MIENQHKTTYNQRMQLTIRLNPAYPIHIGTQLLKMPVFLNYCRSLKKKLVIVYDDNTAVRRVARDIHQQLPEADWLSFPSGEIHKTRETKQHLEDQLLARQYGRDTCLIAVGGGVACDMVGFLASTYCRGVDTLYIPTTLLAMVDASIGGKTAVNTPHGKNLIGTFHQPKAVFMDIQTLETLPPNEYKNGMVEIIKHAVIADPFLFRLLEKSSHNLIDIIYRSCMIKKNIVEQDEKEAHLRQCLNFGHTIGHAIEQQEKYALSHGEAVAIGMLVEAYLSCQYGFLSQTHFDTLEKMLVTYELPLKTRAFENKKALLDALVLDKKSQQGEIRCVLLHGIGQIHHERKRYTFPLDPLLLDHTLTWAAERFQP